MVQMSSLPDWVVPWGTDQAIDFFCLLVAAVVVTAVPVFYGMRANLRDPLARAVLLGTGATATAFIVATLALIAFHAGWTPNGSLWHWITRFTYLTVAFGKLMLLLALMSVLRSHKHRDDNDRASFPETDRAPQ